MGACGAMSQAPMLCACSSICRGLSHQLHPPTPPELVPGRCWGRRGPGSHRGPGPRLRSSSAASDFIALLGWPPNLSAPKGQRREEANACALWPSEGGRRVSFPGCLILHLKYSQKWAFYSTARRLCSDTKSGLMPPASRSGCSGSGGLSQHLLGSGWWHTSAQSHPSPPAASGPSSGELV